MRKLIALVAWGALTSCTSVRMVQREGCWVRQTSHFWSVKEEMGPCSRADPKWADDRTTRVVQECVAQADYRWNNQALAAWSRGQPIPVPPPEGGILKECIEGATRARLSEAEPLKQRLAELNREMDALHARTEQDHAKMLTSYDKLADALGEAAKRPPAPAVATATATSEGRSSSDGRSRLEGGTPRRVEASGVPAAYTPPAQPPPRPHSAKKEAGKPKQAQEPPADPCARCSGEPEGAEGKPR
jgi:hypothetical protein